MPDHELLRLNSTWSSLTRGELVSAILSKQSIKSSLEGKRAKYPISWERKKERQSISCRDRRYMYISIYLHHGAFKDMHSRKVRKVGVAIGVCERERGRGEMKDCALFTSCKWLTPQENHDSRALNLQRIWTKEDVHWMDIKVLLWLHHRGWELRAQKEGAFSLGGGATRPTAQ